MPAYRLPRSTAALVASALYRQPDHLAAKLLTLIVVLVVTSRTRHLGITLLSGLATLWLLGWLLG